jgi:hypothetical protein
LPCCLYLVCVCARVQEEAEWLLNEMAENRDKRVSKHKHHCYRSLHKAASTGNLGLPDAVAPPKGSGPERGCFGEEAKAVGAGTGCHQCWGTAPLLRAYDSNPGMLALAAHAERQSSLP